MERTPKYGERLRHPFMKNRKRLFKLSSILAVIVFVLAEVKYLINPDPFYIVCAVTFVLIFSVMNTEAKRDNVGDT